MKSTNRYAAKPLVAVLAAVLATGTVAGPALAAAAPASETVSIRNGSAWDDPGMTTLAARSGRALIRHLETARALLDTGSSSQARGALIAGREFADAMKRVMPYSTVVSEIRDAGKRVVEQDITSFKTDLVPVYASLDDVQVFAPQFASRTRAMVHKAEKNATAGDKTGAARVLSETADDIIQHTVYLPVGYVDKQVHSALDALDKPKPDVTVAKAAINRALDSVTMVTTDVVDTVG